MTAATQDALWEIVCGKRQGILATINADGTPHLSNVYYVTDPTSRVIRVSTTLTRVKGQNLQRDSRAVLHVSGDDFLNFAVAEGKVMLDIAREPGDTATNELYAVHSVFRGEAERPAFDHEIIADQRLVARIYVTNLYGLVIRK